MAHGGALMPLTIGVDIGGTKVLAGVVDASGSVLARTRRETGESAASISDAIVDAITELAGDHEIGAVGLSAAGFISADRTTVLSSPNIAGWSNIPLAHQMSERVGLPVVLENDANCAAWGEVRFGAGRGRGNVVMITVGTGIGGGIVLDGHLVRGAFGIGGEPGHMRVVPEGLPCGCGQRGCWEQYGSGSALLRRARELGYTGAGGPPLADAARAGDEAARQAFAEIAGWLGSGIATVCALLDPELIMIGGGVSESGDVLMDPLRQSFQAHLPATDDRPHAQIEVALLGADAGMIGAADLARDRANA